MLQDYEVRHLQAAPPQTVGSNAAISAGILDTKGYQWAKFVVELGATNINLATLYVNESDKANMASATIVPGSNFGGDNNDTGSVSNLPTNGGTNTLEGILINCKVSKRYLQLVGSTAVQANGQAIVSSICELSRPSETPRSASEAGFDQRMIATSP